MLARPLTHLTMTDLALPPIPRIMSNKENPQPYPSLAQTMSSSTPKPRLGGVGRAPKRPRKHSLAKPYARKGSFSHKSRFRQTSIQRAKMQSMTGTGRKRSLGKKDVKEDFKIAADPTVQPQESFRLSSNGSSGQAQDRALRILPASIPYLAPAEIEGAVVPSGTVDADDTIRAPAATMVPTKVKCIGRVPVQLPTILKRPMIPPVLHDTEGDCAVPIDYVLQRITPFFARIHRLLPLFEEASITLRTPPQRIHTPTFSTPSGPMQRLDDMYDTLPFWVDQAIPYAGLNAAMQKQAFHWGPDACLVVRKKGVKGTSGEFYPIKKLVLTSQCAFFEDMAVAGYLLRGESTANPDKDQPSVAQLVAREVRARLPRPIIKTRTSASRTTIARPQPIRVSGSRWTSLAPSAEGPAVVVDLAQSSPPSATAQPAQASGSTQSPTRPSRVVSKPYTRPPSAHPLFHLAHPVETYPPPKPPVPGPKAYATRQLDLIPIYLPDPASFPGLLTALHYPGQSPIRHLLPLPTTGGDSETIIEFLRCLPPQQLDDVMDRIFGLYSNIVELGISNESIWTAINRAWAVTYIAKQRRSQVHPPMVEKYDEKLGPVIKWKMVVRLPRVEEKVPE